jgi:peptide/nickel transport system permease protein
MLKYIIRRIFGFIPLLGGAVLISFFLMQLAPGGPAAQMEQNPRISEEEIDLWLAKWCLTRGADPLAIAWEFAGWLGVINCQNEGPAALFSEQGGLNFLPTPLGGGDNGIIHGDLGISINAGRPVYDVVMERIPATLILTITALVIWVTIAVIAGTYAALRRYSFFDQALTLVSYILYSLPTFWLGLMLIFTFGVGLHLLPTGGIITTRDWSPFNTPQYWEQFGADPIAAIVDIGRHLILPVATIVAVNIAADSRFVRSSMLEALSQDFVRTAKAKGLPGRVVVLKHAFRNATLPVVTNVGLEIPFLFSGAIITETIFAWPGMGRLFYDSLVNRDYFVLMGLLLFTTIIILIANLIADVVYALADPRIRYD